MAKAKTIKDIPGEVEQRAETRDRRKRHKSRASAFEGKTFEALNAKGKDALLKALGVAAGLIKDSEDE